MLWSAQEPRRDGEVVGAMADGLREARAAPEPRERGRAAGEAQPLAR